MRVRWGGGEVRCGIYIYIYISKMVTFIKMVITPFKNRSPDMILTPFGGKIHEKKDEIPPGPVDL